MTRKTFANLLFDVETSLLELTPSNETLTASNETFNDDPEEWLNNARRCAALLFIHLGLRRLPVGYAYIGNLASRLRKNLERLLGPLNFRARVEPTKLRDSPELLWMLFLGAFASHDNGREDENRYFLEKLKSTLHQGAVSSPEMLLGELVKVTPIESFFLPACQLVGEKCFGRSPSWSPQPAG